MARRIFCPKCRNDAATDETCERNKPITCGKCGYVGLVSSFFDAPNATPAPPPVAPKLLDHLICPNCADNMPLYDNTDLQKPLACPICGFSEMESKFPEALKKWVVCQCGAASKVFIDRVDPLTCYKCKRKRDIGAFRTKEGADDGGTYVEGMTPKQSKMLALAALVLTEGACMPKKLVLLKGTNTIGRKATSSRASIQIETDDEYMGRNHARIDLSVCQDRSFYEYALSDTGSANGTWKNEKRLEHGEVAILQQNDTIRIGRTTFQFKPLERAT